MPSFTSTQRDGLSPSPVLGSLIYNSTTSTIQEYTGSGWADIFNSNVISPNNFGQVIVGVLTLTAISALATRPDMLLLRSATSAGSGIGTPNDGGGGWFFWVPALTIADDGYNFISPSGAPSGRYVRLFQSPARMSTAQRNVISPPTTGMLIYNTDTNRYEFYNGTSWLFMSAFNTVVVPVTVTNRSGTIALASVTQPLMAANPNRNGFLIQNLSPTYDIWLNDLGSSATISSPSIQLPPLSIFVSPLGGASATQLNVISAGIGAPYSAREW